MKLKDFVNQKVNSRNNQISLDVKKIKLKGSGLDVDDLLNMNIPNSKVGNFKGEDFL